MILLKTEEDVIVQYIHDLVVRGFPPRLAAVKDIADSLLAERHRNAGLQAANEASSKRRSRKRKRVQQEGTLTVEEGVRLTTLGEFTARSDGKKAKKRARADEGEPTQRRCKLVEKALRYDSIPIISI
jgi:hypothetical protein